MNKRSKFRLNRIAAKNRLIVSRQQLAVDGKRIADAKKFKEPQSV